VITETQLALRLDRHNLATFCFLVAFMLVAFVAAVIGFTWLGFLAGWRLTRIQPLLALGLTLLLPFTLGRRFPSITFKWRSIAALAFVLVLGLSLFVGSAFADFSCDGQGYHGTGMLQLLEGWNPIREPGHAEAPQALQREVMVHYAKGPWIVAAALSALVGKVEAGKAATLLLMAACFFLALHAGLKYSRLGPAKLLIVGALVVLNPISLVQCLTLYVDGQLAALFTCLVLCSCLQLRERHSVNVVFTILTIVLLVNVKLTALIYVSVFGLTFALGAWALKKLKAVPSLAAAYAIGILLGLAVGYNPYVTNLRETGNPFFPFTLDRTKQGTEDNFLVHQMPTTFRERNRIETFARSVFGRCWNGYDDASQTFTGSPLKIPFTVGTDELRWFDFGDVRICGWGPLTSGVLVFALAAFIGGTGGDLRNQRRLFGVLCLCILATIFAVPHPWYARYVPQLWLLPVIAAVVLFLSKRRLPNVLGSVLVLLMIANLLLVSVPCFRTSLATTRLLHTQLRWLAAQNRVYSVAFGDYVFNRRRFQEFGIRYRAVETLAPQTKQLILAGETSSKSIVSLEE
jgi:hypothetical protein